MSDATAADPSARPDAGRPAFRGVSSRLAPFGTTIFAEMTRLAVQHGAINLAQGFPDFDGPDRVKQAAARAIADGHGQYSRLFGVPPLTDALERRWARLTGLKVEAATGITVTAGATEAIAAAVLGLCEPGDEVVVFEPVYDSYLACLAVAGAVPRFVTLREPASADGSGEFAFDPAEFRAAFGPRTRAVIVNTPHNPSGKVFSRDELALIADLCCRHDVVAVTDEVYEHLVYEADQPHRRLATFPGMEERTLTVSSLGKTFSLTGWKIGWAIGPERLTRAVRAAHQYLTYCAATPLQHAAAAALEGGDGEIATLTADLRLRRDELLGALRRIGFRAFRPAAAYFIVAECSRFLPRLGAADDRSFARLLTEKVGVATIPTSVFYSGREPPRPLIRFAFCKRAETLREAELRLERGLAGGADPGRAGIAH